MYIRKWLTLIIGLLISVQLLAQNRTISGRITDNSGNGVPNASVLVKGTAIGTTTTENGSFSLSVPSTATTLVISSVGFTAQEISIGSRTTIDVQLAPSGGDLLDQVIVTVPYGTIKKTAFTGSEATISAKTLSKQQVTSVTRALEGQVAGVSATNGGGAPGTGANIQIRGVGSVNANSSPLYVLNGVPYDGSIAAISTDDIESITVLKDAAAAALYGSRAANGVVMITTKKGKKGKSTASVTMRQGFMSRGIPEYDRVNPQQYYELFWEAYRNSYISQGDDPAIAGQKASDVLTSPSGLVYNAYNVPGNTLVDPVTGKLNPNAQLLWSDSWEDALYRTALRTNANVNVSGAGDRSDYYLSAGYLNEEGIVKFSDYRRYNLRLNVNSQATNWLSTGINLDGAVAKRNDLLSGGTATSNPFYYTRQLGPIYPVWQRNPTTGAFIIDPATGDNQLDWGVPSQMGTRPYAGNSNLLGSLDLDDNFTDLMNGNANTYAEIKFLRDFSFRGALGVNFYASNSTAYQNNQYGDAAPSTPNGPDGGRSTKTNDRQISLTGNQVLSWDRDFGPHNVRALVGHENYKYDYSFVSANATGFLFPGRTELDEARQITSHPSSGITTHRIESYFSNINYNYDQKYLASFSYRTDGSSRFHPDVRWGKFYSAGLGWRISQEKFLADLKWLNELKLKASYGEQGNEDIGLYYAYQTYYAAGTNGTNVVYTPPTAATNPDLQWETNKNFNIGFDFAVMKNRMQGSIEYFDRRSENLLFNVPLYTSGGNQTMFQNIGIMKNSGVELSLGYTAIEGRNFNWRIDLIASKINNKMIALPPAQKITGVNAGVQRYREGRDIFDFYLREFAGVDAANGDALYYKDVLGADGKPTGERVLTSVYAQATEYYHGSALPDFSGAITNSFRYKGFELSALATFAYGGLFYDGNYQSIMHRGAAGTHLHTDALNRWQKPGDITNVPRLQNAIAGQDGASSRWLVDGSYLNIKNVTLSYTLPSSITRRMNVGGLMVFANIDNAHLFTAKKGMDPQRAFDGTADATYTPYKTINFGINLNFQ